MNSDGNLILEIESLTDALAHVRDDTGTYSVGGMATKLEAIDRVSRDSIPALIANGRRYKQLDELISGSGLCTRIKI